MLVYRHDSLMYWSDNTLSFNSFDENLLNGKRFDSISNGWYVIKPYLNDSIRAYGLILVKTQYPYENDFLVNGFQPDLKLPSSTELLTSAATRFIFCTRLGGYLLVFYKIQHE